MLKRFTISLDEKLLEHFDIFIKQQKYVNRSEAIRDMIRSALVEGPSAMVWPGFPPVTSCA